MNTDLNAIITDITSHYDNERATMQPKIARLLKPKKKRGLKSLAELPKIIP